MLANPEHVQPDVLGMLGDPGDALDPLMLGRLVTGLRVGGVVPNAEDAEFHWRFSARLPLATAQLTATARPLSSCAVTAATRLPW
jgi:hypothetical protein